MEIEEKEEKKREVEVEVVNNDDARRNVAFAGSRLW